MNTLQEATEIARQPREDPGVIDTRICSGGVSQENTGFLRSTRDVGQGRGLNLKNVCP